MWSHLNLKESQKTHTVEALPQLLGEYHSEVDVTNILASRTLPALFCIMLPWLGSNCCSETTRTRDNVYDSLINWLFLLLLLLLFLCLFVFCYMPRVLFYWPEIKFRLVQEGIFSTTNRSASLVRCPPDWHSHRSYWQQFPSLDLIMLSIFAELWINHSTQHFLQDRMCA